MNIEEYEWNIWYWRIQFSWLDTICRTKVLININNIEYVNSSYGSTLSPSKTVFHTNKGKIVKDSIKYYINSFGQRGENYSLEKSDDEIRVIFLGGSHIFDLNYYYYE